MHFNSHAHVERDRCWGNIDFGIKISTHTLTWSVTIPVNVIVFSKNISTHTLTWSVTKGGMIHSYTVTISTHTLTWSVTLDVVYIWCLLNVMRTYFFI